MTKRREFGTTGRARRSLYQFTLDTDEYLSSLKHPSYIPIYERMGRSDSQVKAILLMLELPIRSTQWFIKSYDNSPKAKKISNFIQDSLFGDYPNGISNGFDEFLKNICTMFQFGHSVFEKVFEVKNGHVKWKKFAVRPQSTIYEFLYDNVGDVKGVTQTLVNQGFKYVDIGINKLLIFTHDKQQGNIEGISALRSAYKHWSIKDFLYKILNVGVERNLVGTPVLTLPENYTQNDFDIASNIVSDLRSSEFGGVTMPKDFMLEMFEGKRTLIDVLPYIEYQDRLISKSILAQFMDLGSSSSGSFALSYDQSQMFLLMLESAAKNICNIINSHAIPELVNHNFSSNLYPKLTFKPLNSGRLINVLKTLTDGGLVVPDEDLEEWIRDMLDLPDKKEEEESYITPEDNQLNQQTDNGENKDENMKSEANQEKAEEDIKSDDEKGSTENENIANNTTYKDRIKDNNLTNTKKMSENYNIDFFNCKDIKDIMLKQLNDMNEKVIKLDASNWCTIKPRYIKQLTDSIFDYMKSIKLSENNNLYIRASLKASDISSKLKNNFLNQQLNGNNSVTNFDVIINNVIKLANRY